MKTDTDEIIKKLTQELLEKLQIKSKIVVKADNEVYEVNIETEDSGLLIGYHGSSLNAFQLILATLVFKETNKWQRVLVNIGDYRQKREETLKVMANQYAQQAIETQEVVVLPYLTPSERRVIHLAIQDHSEVTSESQGEGKDRRITIKPKTVSDKDQ